MDADLIVLGGGAAGFFGAIAAAQRTSPRHVVILERSAQTLAKVRISGGGRCNATHACFEPAELITRYPRGGLALRGPLTRFGPRQTVDWFAARGVALKKEPDGRMFPVTDDSATIVDCLERAAREAGVDVRLRATVVAIAREADAFTVTLQDGETLRAPRVLLATGGAPQGHALARALGHTLVPPAPSLFTFEIADDGLRGLSGLSVPQARVRLLLEPLSRDGAAQFSQIGPVLITHWGLSGPAVLRLSAWAARELAAARYVADLEIAWITRLKPEAILDVLAARKRNTGGQHVGTQSPFGEIPLRLWKRLVARSGIHEAQIWAKLPRGNADALVRTLTGEVLRIVGKGQFKEEFVTAGGVALDEVDFRMMESRICPGLYFAGEVLDIDGITGGFNFQAAWTTGWIAGQAA